ncbi:hypothetical protein [Williamsia sp. DF01-3]|uniref:hypothetical protein n=1 Tax=Williamsia sp. DF01-3 TaxID=2934157 RepID=UPI001FF32235|nr:hypothetical protein [Williamsia sp. DF01-3]MCK0519315.1 hypothetical protein [Williamsia sp. DF01-3]
MPGDGNGFEQNRPITMLAPTVDMPTRHTAEIRYVTAVEGDDLTLNRHTEDSVPMQVKPGWRVMASATAKTFSNIEQAIGLKADTADIPDVAGKADTTTSTLASLPSRQPLMS